MNFLVSLMFLKMLGGPMDMLDYAKRFIGVSYTWGGSSAEEGFDCSGYVQEVLASVGQDPEGDQTAQNLFHSLKHNMPFMPMEPLPGYLLFFGKDVDSITHVAIALNHSQMIEAGGEGRRPSSQGMVRVRPISNRNDLVAILSPIRR